jgi:LmbE family N-acetylglucosaminyl deacetylase
MNVVVVACHPDDETLGCGGALLKHRSTGDKIFWIIATSMKNECGFSNKAIARRNNEIRAVAKAYRFDKVYQLGFPTTKIDHIPVQKIVRKISEVFHEIKPSVVYLPFRADVHSDHRVIFEAAYSCTKKFRYPFIKKVLMMEAISETEFAPSLKECAFIPNLFVDVSDHFKEKLAIMKIYKDELGANIFPRSLQNMKSLAVFRGATAGCRFAEAFVVLKEVWG